jgi:hypothetical protein
VQSEFPNFVFEEGFEEEDVTWTSERETRENMEKRAKLVLDRIFQDHDDTCAPTSSLSPMANTSVVFKTYLLPRIVAG